MAADITPATTESILDGIDLAAHGLGDLSPARRDLLAALLNPAYAEDFSEGTTPQEILTELEDFSAYMNQDRHDLTNIAERLLNSYRDRVDMPECTFDIWTDSEGITEGVTIGVISTPNPVEGSGWEAEFTIKGCYGIENKHTSTDRENGGVRAALGIAEALDQEYDALIARVRRHGLLDRVRLETVDQARRALAAYAAVPASEDVDVDTMAALVESLTAMLAPFSAAHSG